MIKYTKLKDKKDFDSDDVEYSKWLKKLRTYRKSRTYYCKIVQMILIGCFVTLFILITVVLLFSYTKFHEILNDLKKEVEINNMENRKSIDDLKQHIDQYDFMFKQLESRLELLNKNNSTYQESIKKTNTIKGPGRHERDVNDERMISYSDASYRLAKSLRSIDVSNRLNSFIIRWLLNQTQSSPYTSASNSPSNITKSNILSKILLSTNLYKNNKNTSNYLQQNSTESTIYYVPSTHVNDTQTQYTSLVEQFLKLNNDLVMLLYDNVTSQISPDEFNFYLKDSQFIERYIWDFQNSIKNEILTEVNENYIKPLLDAIVTCKCPVDDN